MDESVDAIRELLGTLTSNGRHYSGLTEDFAKIVLDEISTIPFEDMEHKKRFENYARTVLENATKHRELIEKVLDEWKKISIKNAVQSNASSSSDKAIEPPEKSGTKAASKTDIQNIIKHIEYIKESPRMFFHDDFSN